MEAFCRPALDCQSRTSEWSRRGVIRRSSVDRIEPASDVKLRGVQKQSYGNFPAVCYGFGA